MRRFFLITGFLCLAQVDSLNAALVTTTTGVYDEQVNRANTIETTATPPLSSGVSVSYVTLNDFKTKITTAFANGTGGVINFDDLASQIDSSIQASYALGTKTLTVNSPGSNFQIDMVNSFTAIGATPISGNVYLRSATATQIYNFASPLNDLGFTILGRATTRSIAVTLGYSDGTNSVLNNVTIAASGTTPINDSSAGDTFFGFTAPAGKAITSLTLTPTPSGDFFVVDDIGFVTSAIPEPSSVALLATLSVGGLWGLRRRFNR